MYQLEPADLIAGREYLGLSQSALARATGFGRANICRYESGDRTPPPAYGAKLVELAEARRCQLEAQALTPVPAPQVKAAPEPEPPAKFLKDVAKLPDDKIAELPAADFESIIERLNRLSVSSYDDRIKVRSLDIMARLRLARARADVPPDVPAPKDDSGNPFDRLTGPEFALWGYLNAKLKAEPWKPTGPSMPWVTHAVAVLTTLGLQP